MGERVPEINGKYPSAVHMLNSPKAVSDPLQRNHYKSEQGLKIPQHSFKLMYSGMYV